MQGRKPSLRVCGYIKPQAYFINGQMASGTAGMPCPFFFHFLSMPRILHQPILSSSAGIQACYGVRKENRKHVSLLSCGRFSHPPSAPLRARLPCPSPRGRNGKALERFLHHSFPAFRRLLVTRAPSTQRGGGCDGSGGGRVRFGGGGGGGGGRKRW